MVIKNGDGMHPLDDGGIKRDVFYFLIKREKLVKMIKILVSSYRLFFYITNTFAPFIFLFLISFKASFAFSKE